MVRLIIRNKIHVFVTCMLERSYRHRDHCKSALFLSWEKGHHIIISLFLTRWNGSASKLKRQKKTASVLLTADDFAYHTSLLDAKIIDVTSTNYNGMQPLPAACSMRYVDIVELLLDRNAEVSTLTEDSLTKLYIPAKMFSYYWKEVLIHHNAMQIHMNHLFLLQLL